MSTLQIFDLSGKKVGDLELAAHFDESNIKKETLRVVTKALQANQRQGNASTKTKSLVAGSGIKQWKQKGTGRARCHYRRSNVWRGGYAAFGPLPKDYRVVLPKAQRRLACESAWASKIKNGQVKVVNGLVLENPKTKTLLEILKTFGLNRKVLIIVEKAEKNLLLASQNLQNVQVLEVREVNALYLLLSHAVLISEQAFQKINQSENG